MKLAAFFLCSVAIAIVLVSFAPEQTSGLKLPDWKWYAIKKAALLRLLFSKKGKFGILPIPIPIPIRVNVDKEQPATHGVTPVLKAAPEPAWPEPSDDPWAGGADAGGDDGGYGGGAGGADGGYGGDAGGGDGYAAAASTLSKTYSALPARQQPFKFVPETVASNLNVGVQSASGVQQLQDALQNLQVALQSANDAAKLKQN